MEGISGQKNLKKCPKNALNILKKCPLNKKVIYV